MIALATEFVSQTEIELFRGLAPLLSAPIRSTQNINSINVRICQAVTALKQTHLTDITLRICVIIIKSSSAIRKSVVWCHRYHSLAIVIANTARSEYAACCDHFLRASFNFNLQLSIIGFISWSHRDGYAHQMV